MKKSFKLLFLAFLLSSYSQIFAGPPSIEMSIYPRSTPGDIQNILNFAKEQNGKIKLKKLIYENDVLKEISGTLEFSDGVKTEFNAGGEFKRLYIKRTFGEDNKVYVKVMTKSEDE